MNFVDISVKESPSTVTAIVHLATYAKSRTGGRLKSRRAETRQGDTGEEQASCTIPGAMIRGGGYRFNSNWMKALSFAMRGFWLCKGFY